MKESAFQSLVTRELRDSGCLVMTHSATANMGPGWPDVYVAHHTFHGWVELKVGNRILTMIQERRIRHLLDQGVPAFVLRYFRHPLKWALVNVRAGTFVLFKRGQLLATLVSSIPLLFNEGDCDAKCDEGGSWNASHGPVDGCRV